ncbi:hypothetical protein [Dyella silvae]|uniref:hypothetical protein n=1 Tax=Dyella silvae TaxID=2994424 RepID=UPI002264AF67|nr:hypothetical protein [Dyella silvae]
MTTNNTPYADHIASFEQNLSASVEQLRVDHEQPYSADEETEMLHTTDPAEMIRQVERRRDAVTKLLSETTGTFDKNTGKPHMVIPADHPRRRSLEIELHQLTAHTLPMTQARAADIAARKAVMPTTEERLKAEGERQQRIHQAALKRAEEMEIEEAAKRLRAQRQGAR